MKSTLRPEHGSTAFSAGASLPHYQIYRQTRVGIYLAEYQSDSAEEIVEVFLADSPAFEGGAMHIWNHREQRASASVCWVSQRTEFGFSVRSRVNVFHDERLAVIARRIHEREAMLRAIQRPVQTNA